MLPIGLLFYLFKKLLLEFLAQVSFSNCLSSVRKLFTFSSFSPEPLLQFEPNKAILGEGDSILGEGDSILGEGDSSLLISMDTPFSKGT